MSRSCCYVFMFFMLTFTCFTWYIAYSCKNAHISDQTRILRAQAHQLIVGYSEVKLGWFCGT